MLTNADVYLLYVGHAWHKKDLVRLVCAKHNIDYDEYTMGSVTLADRAKRTAEKCKRLTFKKRDNPFMSEEFILRVLPPSASACPTAEQHLSQQRINRELKRKVCKIIRL